MVLVEEGSAGLGPAQRPFEECAVAARMNPKDFTRRRSLPLPELVTFLLNLRKGDNQRMNWTVSSKWSAANRERSYLLALSASGEKRSNLLQGSVEIRSVLS